MTDFIVVYTMANKENRDGFLAEIQEKKIDQLSRHEEGCIKYSYYLPIDSDNQLMLWEQWESRKHQADHVQTEHFALLGLLKKKYGVDATIDIIDR